MTVETIVSAPLGVAGEYPSHDNKLGLGGVHIFTTIAERDAMWTELKDKDTIALVGVGENKFPSWYKWESDKWHFAGYFGGVVLADVDGALTHVDSTAVFGSDFEIQSAGDTGQGVLIMLSEKLKEAINKNAKDGIAGIEVAQDWGDYSHLFTDISKIHARFPLEVNKVGSDDNPTMVAFGIAPATYERHHDEARLAYFDMSEVIIGKSANEVRRGALWADDVSYGLNNADITVDRGIKAVHLQDPYNDDPSATGGAAMLCALHLAFYGKAPNDGTIEIYRINNMTGDVLVNEAGQPMGFIHHYKAGDDITPITIAQIYMAKGIVNAVWCVKHTFTDDPIKIKDWDVGSSCMLDTYIGKESVNPALNEFQEVIGKPIRVQKKYYGADAFSNSYSYQFDITQGDIDVNQGEDSVIGADFENPTKLKVALENSTLNIKDVDGALAYFNTGIELTHEDTVNLRGKEVSVTLDAFTRYDSLELYMFVYTGDMASVPHPIVTGYSNDAPIVAAGWDAHDHGFLEEHPEGSFHPLTKSFVIPNAASLVMFGVVPGSESSPTNFSLKPMSISVDPAFTVHEVNLPKSGGELGWDFVTSEFVTNNKMWKVGKTKTNLPFGEKPRGSNKAPVELYVEEDDANAYKGGLKLNGTTDYSIEIWINALNYYKAKLAQDETANFWIEVGGQKISSSPELIMKDGDYSSHVIHWKFDYTNQIAGTVLELYGQSSTGTAVFLMTGTDNAVGVIVTAKVIK